MTSPSAAAKAVREALVEQRVLHVYRDAKPLAEFVAAVEKLAVQWEAAAGADVAVISKAVIRGNARALRRLLDGTPEEDT